MHATSKLLLSTFMLVALCGIMFSSPVTAQAALNPVTLTSDLDALTQQGNDLVNTINNTVLTPFTAPSQLANIESSILTYNDNITTVYNDIIGAAGSAMSLDNSLLAALQNLSSTQAALSQGTMGLSAQLAAISTASLSSSFYTILRLSDDIGVMANRIMEMADKILVMADNIGIMADRILETQVIQNNNIELVVAASLQTQRNMITLFELFSL